MSFSVIPALRPPLRSLSTPLAVLLILTAFITVPATRAHAAPLEQHTPASYNTLGSRWSEVSILSRNNDLIAVQEAGGTPTNVQPGRRWQVPGAIVNEYHWWTDGTVRYLYHLVTTSANGRTNLAFVTHGQADAVEVITPRLPTSRMSLGVRFGATWFFNFHAIASGNARNDATTMINEINDRVGRTIGGNQWALLGDFNIDLQTTAWQPPTGYIYRSGRPTHRGGGELDFMVASRPIHGYGARVLNGQRSDHWPVEYRPALVASGATNQLFSMHAGATHVDVLNGGDGEPARFVQAYENHVNSHQNYTALAAPRMPGWIQFRNQFNSRCLAISGAQDNAPVVSRACNAGDVNQLFAAYNSQATRWLGSGRRSLTNPTDDPYPEPVIARVEHWTSIRID